MGNRIRKGARLTTQWICWLASLQIFCISYSYGTIYGDNDLIDIQLTPDSHVIELARSVAVQMRGDNVRFELPIITKTLASSYVCPQEKFVSQPVAGNCTAFLISSRYLITASHCLAGLNDPCKSDQWVFDFSLKRESDSSIFTVPENVYFCKRVVQSNYVEKLDYAIIELDREVTGRPGLALDRASRPLINRKIFSIHSPRGLPLKTSQGFIREDSGPNHFTSAIDLMRGSSGAPIFDYATHEVIGIVAQGDYDYELVEEPFCNRYKRCGEYACRGEDATRINRIHGLDNFL